MNWLQPLLLLLCSWTPAHALLNEEWPYTDSLLATYDGVHASSAVATLSNILKAPGDLLANLKSQFRLKLLRYNGEVNGVFSFHNNHHYHHSHHHQFI